MFGEDPVVLLPVEREDRALPEQIPTREHLVLHTPRPFNAKSTCLKFFSSKVNLSHDLFIKSQLVRPFHPMSSCLTQLSLGPYVVSIWSRNVQIYGRKKPSTFTEWCRRMVVKLFTSSSLSLSMQVPGWPFNLGLLQLHVQGYLAPQKRSPS